LVIPDRVGKAADCIDRDEQRITLAARGATMITITTAKALQ
jgi:hypothetical protein